MIDLPPAADPHAIAPGVHPPRKEAAPPVPETFFARVLAVLLTPFQAFRVHDASWGWWQAWMLVAAAGVLTGAISLWRVDHEAWQHAQWERVLEQMPAAKRKQIEKPEVAEQMEKFRRFQAFLSKVGRVAFPPLGGLFGVLFAGALIFVAGRALAPEPPDLPRCLSVAAFASLANLIAWAGEGWGALLGNPQPTTSLAALTDPLGQPVLAAALSRVDPALFAYYLLLAAGLAGSARLRTSVACALSGGLYVLASLALVGMSAASKAMSGMG
ncbi:MAG: hypothetical protein AB7N76_30730 [Planctomycetota bacterium]